MPDHNMYSILIVDDNLNNLFTLRTLLESSLDADVIEAESGFAALEKVLEQKIDLILLDIQMPDINGFEVAKLIRSRPKYRDIPIIFVTAVYKSEEFKQQGFESGAIDYLTKPIDDTILLNRVKAYLRVISGEREINRQLSEMNTRLQEEVDARKRVEEELEHLNQELKEASQHKTDYLSSMSHELRTPLNALIGYISLSLSTLQPSTSPENLENLVKANQTARVLLQLINDVLDFAKIEAGRIELLLEEIDLTEIVEDVMVTAEGLLLDKPVELKAEIDPDLPFVTSDYTKVKQTLNNLLGNAIKFTAEGYVAVRAIVQENDTGIRIEVEDTGPGIPQDKLDSVFESFKQVDSSIKKKFGGTGLGLTISKRFCDMLGIDIGVESDVDKGTLFWLHIPLESPSEKGADEKKNAVTVHETNSSVPSENLTELSEEKDAVFQSILIIDDEQMNLEVISDILKLSGFTIYQALSGKEGIQIAQNVHPDVILMDLAMPDIDGLEATQYLKQDPETTDILIIAYSAHVTQETREQAIQAGCEGFISKPIEPRRLVSQISHIVLDSRKKRTNENT